MSKKKTTYKIATKGNTSILKEQGIWGLASDRGSYRAFIKNAKKGDQVIFTSRGNPIAAGIVRSAPTQDLTIMFPNGEAYSNIFTVDVKAQGKISREVRENLGISLKKGVVSYSDDETFQLVRQTLKRPMTKQVSSKTSKKSRKARKSKRSSTVAPALLS